MLTFPFNVVAANNLASGVISGVDRMECVVVQASGYKFTVVNMALSKTDNGRITYGFLESLQVVVGLRLLCTLHIALHHRESRQDGREALGTCRRHLERVEDST